MHERPRPVVLAGTHAIVPSRHVRVGANAVFVPMTVVKVELPYMHSVHLPVRRNRFQLRVYITGYRHDSRELEQSKRYLFLFLPLA